MEYGVFKALQALLFFGAALGFGFWQLIALKRETRREHSRRRARSETSIDSTPDVRVAAKSAK